MLRRVAVGRIEISEESVTFIIRARIGELGTTLAVISYRRTLLRNIMREYSCHSVNGGANFLRNVGSYKSHTA
jgi:hypothetical protein